MEVVGPDSCRPSPSGGAVTVGAYDGVHLGHRAVIAQLRERASGKGLETVVVTFDRHPASVVRPESAPTTLTDLEQKLELLANCGVDRTLVIPFDQARSDETAEDFVETVLVGGLGTRLVVVGSNFHFGHDRKGDVALLSEMGSTAGFDVAPVALVVLLVSAGLAIAGLISLVMLALCALSIVLERRRRARAEAGRPAKVTRRSAIVAAGGARRAHDRAAQDQPRSTR